MSDFTTPKLGQEWDWKAPAIQTTVFQFSRRDLFTAAALTGLLANPDRDAEIEGYVQDARNFADAMLEADTK